MADTKPTPMVKLLSVLIVSAVLWWPLYAWQGYVTAIIWKWFVAPLFGVRLISTWEAAGLLIFVHHLMPTVERETDKDNPAAQLVGRALALGVAAPAVALLSAWIVRHLV